MALMHHTAPLAHIMPECYSTIFAICYNLLQGNICVGSSAKIRCQPNIFHRLPPIKPTRPNIRRQTQYAPLSPSLSLDAYARRVRCSNCSLHFLRFAIQFFVAPSVSPQRSVHITCLVRTLFMLLCNSTTSNDVCVRVLALKSWKPPRYNTKPPSAVYAYRSFSVGKTIYILVANHTWSHGPTLMPNILPNS